MLELKAEEVIGSLLWRAFQITEAALTLTFRALLTESTTTLHSSEKSASSLSAEAEVLIEAKLDTNLSLRSLLGVYENEIRHIAEEKKPLFAAAQEAIVQELGLGEVERQLYANTCPEHSLLDEETLRQFFVDAIQTRNYVTSCLIIDALPPTEALKTVWYLSSLIKVFWRVGFVGRADSEDWNDVDKVVYETLMELSRLQTIVLEIHRSGAASKQLAVTQSELALAVLAHSIVVLETLIQESTEGYRDSRLSDSIVSGGFRRTSLEEMKDLKSWSGYRASLESSQLQGRSSDSHRDEEEVEHVWEAIQSWRTLDESCRDLQTLAIRLSHGFLPFFTYSESALEVGRKMDKEVRNTLAKAEHDTEHEEVRSDILLTLASPGSLAKESFWEVPSHYLDQFFFGRDDLLESLSCCISLRAQSTYPTGAVCPFVLFGAPLSGKSTAAAHVMDRVRKYGIFQETVWLPAGGSVTSLSQELAALAASKMRTDSTGLEQTAFETLMEFRTQGLTHDSSPCFVVIDDVNSLSQLQLVRRTFAETKTYTILITSTMPPEQLLGLELAKERLFPLTGPLKSEINLMVSSLLDLDPDSFGDSKERSSHEELLRVVLATPPKAAPLKFALLQSVLQSSRYRGSQEDERSLLNRLAYAVENAFQDRAKNPKPKEETYQHDSYLSHLVEVSLEKIYQEVVGPENLDIECVVSFIIFCCTLLRPPGIGSEHYQAALGSFASLMEMYRGSKIEYSDKDCRELLALVLRALCDAKLASALPIRSQGHRQQRRRSSLTFLTEILDSEALQFAQEDTEDGAAWLQGKEFSMSPEVQDIVRQVVVARICLDAQNVKSSADSALKCFVQANLQGIESLFDGHYIAFRDQQRGATLIPTVESLLTGGGEWKEFEEPICHRRLAEIRLSLAFLLLALGCTREGLVALSEVVRQAGSTSPGETRGLMTNLQKLLSRALCLLTYKRCRPHHLEHCRRLMTEAIILDLEIHGQSSLGKALHGNGQTALAPANGRRTGLLDEEMLDIAESSGELWDLGAIVELLHQDHPWVLIQAVDSLMLCPLTYQRLSDGAGDVKRSACEVPALSKAREVSLSIYSASVLHSAAQARSQGQNQVSLPPADEANDILLSVALMTVTLASLLPLLVDRDTFCVSISSAIYEGWSACDAPSQI